MFDFSHFLTDIYSIALAAVMLLALAYLAIYYGLYHMRVGRYHPASPASSQPLPPVSVVLTASNNADWLRQKLVFLLEQEYPDFEVVVVDYLSHDDTLFVLKLLKDYYPNLKIVPFKEDVNLFQGKKYPLSIGIKSAKNDILILADPESIPQNPHWLSGMVQGYSTPLSKRQQGGPVQIVLGFCGIKPSNSLLGILQQFDALSYGAQYLGSALLGHPYTGSGRNLSYRRSFFFQQGAFISHYDIADGADDLFVYQNATSSNTRVCINPDACLSAEPRPSYSLWLEDRRHRVATRNRHSLASRLHEDLPYFANLLFYLAAVLLVLLASLPWPVVAAAIVAKWTWQIVCFSRLTRRFNAGKIHFAAPLLEIYFVFANTFLILLPLQNNRKYK